MRSRKFSHWAPAALAVALFVFGLSVRPVPACVTCPPTPSRPCGDEGCTPGYWKNHLEAWQGYSPDQTLGEVFSLNGNYTSLVGVTLLDALSFQGGGPKLVDKAEILLKTAVAALLNGNHDSVAYPVPANADHPTPPSPVITIVDCALASNNARAIIITKSYLDRFNNLDSPL